MRSAKISTTPHVITPLLINLSACASRNGWRICTNILASHMSFRIDTQEPQRFNIYNKVEEFGSASKLVVRNLCRRSNFIPICAGSDVVRASFSYRNVVIRHSQGTITANEFHRDYEFMLRSDYYRIPLLSCLIKRKA